MIADWRGEVMQPQMTRTLWCTHKGGIQNDRRLAPDRQSIVVIAWSTEDNGTDYLTMLNITQHNLTCFIVCTWVYTYQLICNDKMCLRYMLLHGQITNLQNDVECELA